MLVNDGNGDYAYRPLVLYAALISPWDLGALLLIGLIDLSLQIPLILLLLILQHADLGMDRRLQPAAKWHCRAQPGTALTHSSSPASHVGGWSHNGHLRCPVSTDPLPLSQQQSIYSWHLLVAQLFHFTREIHLSWTKM